jgi:hypothetical protein
MMQLRWRSTRLQRVVFGVSPNTFNHSPLTKPRRKSLYVGVVVETTTTARETRALPAQLHFSD